MYIKVVALISFVSNYIALLKTSTVIFCLTGYVLRLC